MNHSTSRELESMRRLRAVFKRSSKGLGVAAAFVEVFSASKDGAERKAVKMTLLGTPVERSFAGLVDESAQSGELLRFVAALARVNSSEASRAAEKLSPMFDRWTLLKEKRAMEKGVMAFRGLIVSAVSGVVVGMLSLLAPLIAGFQISLGTAQPASHGPSPYVGAVFLLPSALCLGLYLSPSRPHINVIVSLAAFAGVVSLMGPLATFSLGP